MCDVVSAELLDTDVFGSKTNVTLNTPLETYCDDLASVVIQFNEFCLFPSSDALGTICEVNNKPQSDFIFNEMQTGLIQTLDDLPSLWESSPALIDNKEEWVTAETQTSTPFDGGEIKSETLVFQRLPHFVISKTGVILGTSVIPATRSSYLVSNPTNSLFYSVPKLAETAPQLFAISDDGDVQVIGRAYWTTFTQEWKFIPAVTECEFLKGLNIVTSNGVTYILFLGTPASAYPLILNIYTVSDAKTQDITFFNRLVITDFYAQAIPGSSACMAIQYPFVLLTVTQTYGNPNTPILGTVIVRDITDLGTPLYNLTCDLDQMPLCCGVPANATVNCAAYGFNNSSPVLLMTYSNNSRYVFVQWLAASHQVIGSGNRDGSFLDSTPNGEWIVFQGLDNSNNPRTCLIHNGGISFYINPPTNLPAMSQTRYAFFQPTHLTSVGTFTLFLQSNDTNPLIYTRMLSTGGVVADWINVFNFYSAFVIANDIGATNMPIEYNPGPLWFFGTIKKSLAMNQVSCVSKHNRYRYLFTISTTGIGIGNFDGISRIVRIEIQRHNDYFILQNAFQVKMFQNGNIQALDENSKIIWQTAMSDMNGSFDKFIDVDKINPTVTPNGNYLCYWTSSNTFRQCYYPYNSARFQEYGQLDELIFNNSIDQQSNFCFDNLLAEPTGVTFADDRCACIGGQRLFNNLFINTDTLPASEKALLLDNLPCLMVACSRSRANFDPTNTYTLLLNKCQVPIVICTTMVELSDQASIGNFGNTQDCGTSSFPLPSCTVNEDCPIGSICVDGVCEIACRDKADCGQKGYPNFDCVSGGCIEIQSATGVNQVVTGGLTVGALIGIVFAAVAVILLISLLCWYFLVYKKAHPK